MYAFTSSPSINVRSVSVIEVRAMGHICVVFIISHAVLASAYPPCSQLSIVCPSLLVNTT